MSRTQIPFGPSNWTSPVISMVPRSPKSWAGFQFFARVCLNAVMAGPFSLPNFDSEGSRDEIRERSGTGGSEDALVLVTSVDFGSDILSIREGG